MLALYRWVARLLKGSKMEKIVKKDYPWTIIIEDKVGKVSGKLYQAISVGHTKVKNKEAKDPKEKYETTWLNLFDENDLLKLSSSAENAYQRLKFQRDKEKSEKSQQTQTQQPEPQSEPQPSYGDLDDDIPFDL